MSCCEKAAAAAGGFFVSQKWFMRLLVLLLFLRNLNLTFFYIYYLRPCLQLDDAVQEQGYSTPESTRPDSARSQDSEREVEKSQ